MTRRNARPASSSVGGSKEQDSSVAQPTFENLRQKIEGNLKKIERQDSHKSSRQSQENKNQESKLSNNLRGKKRAANGDVKDVKISTQRQNQPKPLTRPPEDLNEADLKTIIAELGGTEEDLELIGNVDSDSEIEGNGLQEQTKEYPEPRKGKTLESGMTNILREIALVKGKQDDSSSEDEDVVKVNGTHSTQASKADTKTSRVQKETEAPTKPSEQVAANSVEVGKKHKLRCPPRPDWYSHQQPDIEIQEEPKFAVDMQSLNQLHSRGKRLLEAENGSFKSTQMSSSSQAFYNTVIASGTLSDKISALTLAVQESPLHNMKGLENLIGLAGKRSRSQAVDVLRALKDLFAAGTLLPSDRKLNTFFAQPTLLAALGQIRSWNEGDVLPTGIQESHLTVWAFEHWLKDQYFEILKILETWSNDEIEFAKARATTYTYELLKEKPEQEANLLRLLVNKLGDPMKKVASQASYLIMQLLAAHPVMKEVIVTAIDTDFIFKPGQTTHGRYYAVITLNQTALSEQEEKVALRLLNIYFSLFRALLKPRESSKDTQKLKTASNHPRQRKQAMALLSTEQEDELREKLISAILTGVNRAHPYCGNTHQIFDEHVDTLFEITHSANFNTSIQALLLIQQLIATTSSPSERFYRTLYESLLDPRLITSSKQQLYLNLLHRSLKADLNLKRIKAFVKRILQVLSLQEPSFICGAFFLIKDLEKTFPSLFAMIDQAEDQEDEEEMFKDVHEDSNLPDAVVSGKNIEKGGYDPHKRAPEYAKADRSCAWELLPFLAHFHPSVNVSAEHMVEHKALNGKPDLNLHTLIHFLDRFVYKNAKLSEEKMRGSSIMQPLASDDHRAVLISTGVSAQKLPVNSEAFRLKNETELAAEDVFFHQYFKNLGKSAAKKGNKQRAAVSDDASFGSDEEDEVWRVMKGSARDIEGLEEEDQDESDMSDLEAEMQEDQSDEEMGAALDMEEDDDDESVDVEAGILDDSDDEAQEVDVAMSDEAEEAEFEGLQSDTDGAATSKKKSKYKEERERKKKLKALPTFASVADYAQLLDDDQDEDLG